VSSDAAGLDSDLMYIRLVLCPGWRAVEQTCSCLVMLYHVLQTCICCCGSACVGKGKRCSPGLGTLSNKHHRFLVFDLWRVSSFSSFDNYRICIAIALCSSPRPPLHTHDLSPPHLQQSRVFRPKDELSPTDPSATHTAHQSTHATADDRSIASYNPCSHTHSSHIQNLRRIWL